VSRGTELITEEASRRKATLPIGGCGPKEVAFLETGGDLPQTLATEDLHPECKVVEPPPYSPGQDHRQGETFLERDDASPPDKVVGMGHDLLLDCLWHAGDGE